MGKKTNKERRRLREERQAAQRRAERRRNLITLGLVAGIVLVGGVLVWVSLKQETQPGPAEPSIEDGQDGNGSGEDGQNGQNGSGNGRSDGDSASGSDPVEGSESGDATGAAGDDRPVACGASVPEGADQDKPTFDEPEQVLEGVADPRARMTTSCGEVVLDLDVQRAPEAANSFAFLAQQGFFDGLRFFRSRPGTDMVQAGAGDNRSTWNVGYTLPAELQAAEQDGYPPGAVALAVPEGEPAGGGSQFFIVYGGRFMDAVVSGGLGRTYPRFATVAEGLDVVRRIGEIEVVQSQGETRPARRVYIESVEIEPA
jgi:cyclophilin family peptidyl-prolyl cis-trans isomerase